MKKVLSLSLALLLVFGLTLGVFAADPPDKDIVETAVAAAPEFTTLVAAVTAAGLVDTLKGPGPFTVFAPTNAAFADLPAGVLDKLLANPAILTKVLLYHVVAQEVPAAIVLTLDGQEVPTVQGQKVTVSITGGDVYVNDAQVIQTDIFCTNGVIHVIDKVLIPEWDIVETAILNDDFNTLVAAVVAADLVGALKGPGPFTVFAPTDAAFAALPDGLLAALLADVPSLQKVLLYHVLPSKVMATQVLGLNGVSVETLLGQEVLVTITEGKVFINDAEVIITDIECTNGVIHVLNAVLVPDLDADDNGDLPQTGGTAGMLIFGFLLAGSGLAFLKRRV
jgi:transforming growth factor-beta-induced protein